MNKFHYKERDYAETILSEGFTSKYIATELKILAKHFKSQGMDEIGIKKELQTFCENNLKGYNQAIHFKIINNAVSHGLNEKNKIIQIDCIDITENELKAIDQLELPHDFKRVLFTLLVLNKLSKKFIKIKGDTITSKDFYFGGHKNYRELVSTSKITFNKTKKSTVKNIHDLIRLLDEKEIVQITHNGNIKLLFMYDIEEDEKVALPVYDFGVIGLYYDLHHGENRVRECEICKVPILLSKNKRSSSQKKFCDICLNENHKRAKLENWHKNKDKYSTRQS